MRLTVFIFVVGIITALTACKSEKSNSKEKLDNEVSQVIKAVSTDSIKSDIKKLVSFRTRHTMSDTTSDSTGIGAARRWIYHTFQRYREASGNRLKVKYDRYVETENKRIDKPTEIVNVYGVLPGTQLESKDRIYVVSGHYDSRVSDVMNDSSYAPGADDDASGTAAVLELARVMSQHKFDATIIFLTVAGEEQGLLGSTHFAQMAKKRNMNIAGMFTNDIIGNSVKNTDGSVHDDVVRVFAQGIPPKKELSRYDRMLLYTGGENDTPTRELGRFIHRVAKNYVPDFNVNLIYRKDRYLRRGDHSAFLDEGYPAIRFTEPHENYNHQHQDVREEDGMQYGDLPKFVDYDYAAKVTKLNGVSLAVLANAPARPQDVRIVVSKLTNNTTLGWAENNEPDLKGYEIVWRSTHLPYWQHSKFVGDTTRYTVKGVSKDNYLFGVRSVDKYGNTSPAVYPLPARD